LLTTFGCLRGRYGHHVVDFFAVVSAAVGSFGGAAQTRPLAFWFAVTIIVLLRFLFSQSLGTRDCGRCIIIPRRRFCCCCYRLSVVIATAVVVVVTAAVHTLFARHGAAALLCVVSVVSSFFLGVGAFLLRSRIINIDTISE